MFQAESIRIQVHSYRQCREMEYDLKKFSLQLIVKLNWCLSTVTAHDSAEAEMRFRLDESGISSVVCDYVNKESLYQQSIEAPPPESDLNPASGCGSKSPGILQYMYNMYIQIHGLLALYVRLTAVDVGDRAFVKVKYVRRIGQERLRLETVQVAFFGGELPSLHLHRKPSLFSHGQSTKEVFRSNYDCIRHTYERMYVRFQMSIFRARLTKTVH